MRWLIRERIGGEKFKRIQSFLQRIKLFLFVVVLCQNVRNHLTS